MDLDSRTRQRFLLGLLSPGEYELCETGQRLGWSRSLQSVRQELAADHGHPGMATNPPRGSRGKRRRFEAVSGPKGGQGNVRHPGRMHSQWVLISRRQNKARNHCLQLSTGKSVRCSGFCSLSLTLILNISLRPPLLSFALQRPVCFTWSQPYKQDRQRADTCCPPHGHRYLLSLHGHSSALRDVGT